MLEIRFHGRAGQGIVTAADLLASAVAKEGKFSQAFPFFGSEKRGPPVTSYVRIDDKPIFVHEEIEEPDVVVVAEPSVLNEVKTDAGLKENGLMVVNFSRGREELQLKAPRLFVVNGTEIAVKYFNKPITNTVMLGALCKIYPIVKLESLIEAIRERFPEKLIEPNVMAITECYNAVTA